MTSIRPMGTPTHHGLCMMKATASTAAVVPQITEPARPSQDFFGLIAGTIRCLPNNTPAA